MTYLALLDCLRHTPREGWFLTPSGMIRFRAEGQRATQCPITVLLGATEKIYVWVAAEELQISTTLRHEIVNAADNVGVETAGTRRALLEACGLREMDPTHA